MLCELALCIALVQGDDYKVRLLVHQSQAGCIIGKAGYKIKEMREVCDSILWCLCSTASILIYLFEIIEHSTACVQSRATSDISSLVNYSTPVGQQGLVVGMSVCAWNFLQCFGTVGQTTGGPEGWTYNDTYPPSFYPEYEEETR